MFLLLVNKYAFQQLQNGLIYMHLGYKTED